jgi:signal transduction histidine kinase
VTITLKVAKEETVLTISDDGQGFDVNAVRSGVGLNNISSRANILGGNMSISSEQGQGTRMVVRFTLG